MNTAFQEVYQVINDPDYNTVEDTDGISITKLYLM